MLKCINTPFKKQFETDLFITRQLFYSAAFLKFVDDYYCSYSSPKMRFDFLNSLSKLIKKCYL
ncbi:Leucine export protein LeuE [Mycoavidus cysteinexigens]|uniref:Leucine export protein LeuE n=1 Tax=Mycoavidus cysteinexigens TaxID=1553431 RepID=A0A2Z6EX04_9BURK|nr:Leucine export protein LeuE [Mycoavidus cysteinexigens]GLR02272.1 hypothetical protein GCM10007934_20880 [Mycoavidus cysteinexigens]